MAAAPPPAALAIASPWKARVLSATAIAVSLKRTSRVARVRIGVGLVSFSQMGIAHSSDSKWPVKRDLGSLCMLMWNCRI